MKLNVFAAGVPVEDEKTSKSKGRCLFYENLIIADGGCLAKPLRDCHQGTHLVRLAPERADVPKQ